MMEMNIYQRINEIRKKVSYIQKDTKIQGYKAVTHDMVTAKVRESFVEFGVMIVPSQISGGSIDVGATVNGTTTIRYEAVYNINFVNMDKPDDFFLMVIHSHAKDSSDKAPGKALSYAVKSGILKVLMLETGVNDEGRVEGERAASRKISEEQAKWIKDKIVEYDIDEAAFTGWLKKRRASSIEDINEAFFKADVVRMIETKKPKVERNARS